MLLAHMRECLDRIIEYTHAERPRFDTLRLVQDAVIRNLLRDPAVFDAGHLVALQLHAAAE